jgi:hypothetical protein
LYLGKLAGKWFDRVIDYQKLLLWTNFQFQWTFTFKRKVVKTTFFLWRLARLFFLLCSSYLCLFFTTWHNRLDFMINNIILLRYLFYLFKKTLQVWKNVVCRNFDIVFLNISTCFFSSSFHDKTPKPLKYTLSPVSNEF